MDGKRLRYTFQLVFVTFGILLSIYAYYVETSKERDKSYVAMCDISDRISCSKVFTSKWGKGLGLLEDIIGRDHPLNLPNSIPGLIFYALVFCLETRRVSHVIVYVQIAASFLSVLSCVWLAYILFFVLKDTCVVCITMYVINTGILIGSLLRHKEITPEKKKKF